MSATAIVFVLGGFALALAMLGYLGWIVVATVRRFMAGLRGQDVDRGV